MPDDAFLVFVRKSEAAPASISRHSDRKDERHRES
ncbi:MAG: hypothetical protein ACI81R_002645, partial [Bradymonadia bacterium]